MAGGISSKFKFEDRFLHERQLRALGIARVAGVDEVGRGPLAGPVVAGAFIFPSEIIDTELPEELRGLTDSKQLTSVKRERYAELLTLLPGAEWRLIELSASEVDRLNILRATHEAMRQALAAFVSPPQHALVDGLPAKGLPVPQTALVKGDARSYSIAAASVLAKVHRDRLMVEYDRQFPGYGFAANKGYGTPEHLEAIRRLGPCPIHRQSFAPMNAEQLELL